MSVADAKSKGVTGSIGAVPPPDAPIESAQPLTGAALAEHLAKASQNERQLKPFDPPQRRQSPAPVPAPSGTSVPAPASAASALIADVFGEDLPSPAPATDPAAVIPPVAAAPDPNPIQAIDELPPITEDERLRMPAASNTDSPARGRLSNITPEAGDKFAGIQRGGFSDLADAQYFPLTGSELLELVRALMDTVNAQITNDLRFSMGLTYPRVRAVVRVEIEGHAEDGNAGFQIEKVAIPKDGDPGGTPIEVARQVADRICFVVEAYRQEFTPDGEVETPPDAIRAELNLDRPHKQIIESATGSQSFVDMIPGSNVRAVTR